ncbi:MAG TPA: HAMP domain-containing sensor histidine kinase [Chitinophagales bacterium]|nr:HAMP domain-containing sensor histidine kinase [Chitinophagales bacterium]
MKNALPKQNSEGTPHLDVFYHLIKNKSDSMINYFLIGYFLEGLFLAFFYDAWVAAMVAGSVLLLAYYSVKRIWPHSNLYQYILSAVLGIFVVQYIYEMHGLYEMNFLALIGSVLLIAYQNWKLQIPLAVIVIAHHAMLGYFKFAGIHNAYFTQLNSMDLQTFTLHLLLSGIIFFICGLWAFQFKGYSERHIQQSFEIGRLQVAEVQREELIKSNTELDRFVYSVSHDLRAPLCSMLGVIEISEELTKDKVALEHFAMLKTTIGKLNGFISDILTYSKNSRVEVKHEVIHFKEILDEITNDLKYMASDNLKVNIDIKVNNEKQFSSDKSRINVVLNNLIANSIRYQNPERKDPFIKIEVDTAETEALIMIRDNGIGIGKEYQPKIFDMFYRVSNASEGSGLGLYIVKEMIEKLDGQIDFHSELGEGTTFNIRIPNN